MKTPDELLTELEEAVDGTARHVRGVLATARAIAAEVRAVLQHDLAPGAKWRRGMESGEWNTANPKPGRVHSSQSEIEIHCVVDEQLDDLEAKIMDHVEELLQPIYKRLETLEGVLPGWALRPAEPEYSGPERRTPGNRAIYHGAERRGT